MQWRNTTTECVNRETGEERTLVNVVPECYSGEVMHELHPGCWCEPVEDDGVLIHRSVQ